MSTVATRMIVPALRRKPLTGIHTENAIVRSDGSRYGGISSVKGSTACRDRPSHVATRAATIIEIAPSR